MILIGSDKINNIYNKFMDDNFEYKENIYACQWN